MVNGETLSELPLSNTVVSGVGSSGFIGAGEDASGFVGEVIEVLVYTQALDSASRDALTGYLLSRYPVMSTEGTWPVTVVCGERGEVDPAGLTWVEDGAPFEIDIEPDPHYVVSSVLVNDEPWPIDQPLRFESVDEALLVAIAFELERHVVSVDSTHGEPVGYAGELHYGTVVTNVIVEPPAEQGTQWVCQGWTICANSSACGCRTVCVFVVTNDTTLIWNWTTNVAFECAYPEEGGIVCAPSACWYPKGSTLELSAEPDTFYRFERWAGVPKSVETNNPVSFPIDSACCVSPVFVPECTDGRGVPKAWLVDNDLVEEDGAFEEAEEEDADGDGMKAWQEYRAGTSPTDAGSLLAAEVEETPQGSVVRWQAQPGRAYRVWSADRLDAGAFTPCTEEMAYPAAQCALSPPSSGRTVYYRISVRPTP